MGGFTKIQLKDTSSESIKEVNKILDEMKIAKSYRFYSEDDVKFEYDGFVKGTGEFPEHLFPKNKIETYDDFKKYWSTEALGEVFVPPFGSLTFDCYFGRTSQRTMDKIAKFMYENLDLIGEVDGSYSTFIEDKINMSKKKKDVLIKLEEPFEPEELPKDEQTKDDLQSGLWLCKSWSNEPFWVLYGNVDRPVFMKKKIYKDDLYNNLYKCKKGYGFLLMPLMPLDANNDWFHNVMENALNMGLREHPNFLLPILYGVTVKNPDEVIPEIKEWYTQEEIVERFKKLYFNMESDYGYNSVRGFVWRNDHNQFECCGGRVSTIEAKCQALTIMLKATGEDDFANVLKK